METTYKRQFRVSSSIKHCVEEITISLRQLNLQKMFLKNIVSDSWQSLKKFHSEESHYFLQKWAPIFR